MSNQLTVAEKEFLRSFKTGRTKEEIFDDIADRILDSHEGNISQEESRKLARNFIGFCQKFIDIQVRIERENEEKATAELTFKRSQIESQIEGVLLSGV